MKALSLAALALFAVFAAVSPAAAQDINFATEGYVIKFKMPDDWLPDPEPNSAMLVTAPDHSTGITLSILDMGNSPDGLANAITGALKVTPAKKEGAASISGHDGFAYTSEGINDSGVHGSIRLLILPVDARRALVCLLLSQDNLTAAQQGALDSTVASLTIMAPP